MQPPKSKHKCIEKTYPKGKNKLLREVKTPHQLIRIFKNGDDYWMSLNGEMQFHTSEAYKSHRYMCKKPLDLCRNQKSCDVLVVGGGDGLPTQELLRYLPSFTQVELDPYLIDFVKTDPLMRYISRDAFNDPRVNLHAGDGLSYLINSPKKWDVIIDDCDYSVSDQGSGVGKDRDPKYEHYKRCLVNKLKPGGVAVFMEAMYWPWRDRTWVADPRMPQWMKDWKNRYRQWESGPLSKPARREWMIETAQDDLEEWQRLAPYGKSLVVDLPVIGPEHYIYMSNQPLPGNAGQRWLPPEIV